MFYVIEAHTCYLCESADCNYNPSVPLSHGELNSKLPVVGMGKGRWHTFYALISH